MPNLTFNQTSRPKAIGPKSLRLLQTLTSERRLIFDPGDVTRILGITHKRATDFICRLARNGWLFRIRGKRGGAKYALLPQKILQPISLNPYVLASEFVKPRPYYISHLSAMVLHNMVRDDTDTLFISGSIRPKTVKVGNLNFRFVHCRLTKLTWGIESRHAEVGQKIRVSNPMKTIADALDRPDLCGGIVKVAEAMRNVFSRRRDGHTELWRESDLIRKEFSLGESLYHMDSGAVYKRLGYLLEFMKLSEGSHIAWHVRRYSGIVRLDPSKPFKGKIVAKWGLIINTTIPRHLVVNKTLL